MPLFWLLGGSAVDRRELLGRVRKVVVKVGTGSLSNEQGGLDEAQVARLAEQVHALRRRGLQVVVVSSGAIGAGMNALGLAQRPKRLPDLQSCAAVGQGKLMVAYDRCFRKHGYHAAQVLLTREDFSDHRRYLNASNALNAICAMGAVPIINENDTISVEELDLTFGDNDRLAALVTILLGADMLILLTDVEGLYENADAPVAQRRVVPVVQKVTDEIRQMASSARSRAGTGGMVSKIEAARMATEAGAAALVVDARQPKVLETVFDGEAIGTLFLPGKKRLAGHKRWLRFGSRPRGYVIVDAGARRALAEGGKSLLPSGIKGVRGEFERGDLVCVCDEQGKEFAHGLVNYAAGEIQKIMGQKTLAIRRILGDAPYEEAIHRDHLVLSE
jgi:glutamate 5-kinase